MILRLYVGFEGSVTPRQLKCVFEHASQITSLNLQMSETPDDIAWERLRFLEELTFSSDLAFDPIGARSNSDVYDELAHPNGRLRKLSLFRLHPETELSHGLRLCRDIGHRLRDFEVNIMEGSPSDTALTDL